MIVLEKIGCTKSDKCDFNRQCVYIWKNEVIWHEKII